MREIPTIDQLAEAIADAMSAGQALDAREIASLVHGVVMEQRRAAMRIRLNRSRANRRARLLAEQESIHQVA